MGQPDCAGRTRGTRLVLGLSILVLCADCWQAVRRSGRSTCIPCWISMMPRWETASAKILPHARGWRVTAIVMFARRTKHEPLADLSLSRYGL